jgi:hypothetical protein
MTAAANLLQSLRERGIQLRKRGDKIRITAPQGSITPETRQQLAALKPEILRLLDAEQSEPAHGQVGEAGAQWAARSGAVDVLNTARVRISEAAGQVVVSIPAATDSPEVRGAVQLLYGGRLPVVRVEQQTDPEENKRVSWAQWKARALGEIFREHGTTGEPGRITAATVAHSRSHSR